MMHLVLLQAWIGQEAARDSEGLTPTTVSRITTPTPAIPVAVDMFQSPRGFEGLNAAMAGLGFRVIAPDSVGNERIGFWTVCHWESNDKG